MRILIVAPDCPFPPVGGGQLRIYHCLRAVAETCDLTLVAFSWGNVTGTPPFPVRVVEVPWTMPALHEQMLSEDEATARLAHAQLANETEEPFLVSYYQSPAMEETLHRIGRERFDLIILENTFMARFLPAFPIDVPKLLVLHNVLTLMARRRAESDCPLERSRADAERMEKFEKWAVSQCEGCVAVSAQEAEAARSLLGASRVEVIPNGVDTDFFVPSADPVSPNTLLFTGSMNYWPNVRAAQFFCREIAPRILPRNPRAQLHIVGTSPTEEVKALAGARVIVHGTVPDMRPHYARAALVVVPLLDGGGTRLKILEAAACGKAIVSTSIGAEGLAFRSGRDIVLADDADAFADAVVALLDDDKRRLKLGQCARAASRRYDWETIGAEYRRMLEQFISGHTRLAVKERSGTVS